MDWYKKNIDSLVFIIFFVLVLVLLFSLQFCGFNKSETASNIKNVVKSKTQNKPTVLQEINAGANRVNAT